MKKLTFVMCLLFFSSLIFPSSSNAQIVLGPEMFGMGEYALTLENQSQGLFAISITELPNSDFQFDFLGIAELFALYPVSSGQVVSPEFASSTPPFVTNSSNPGQGVVNIPLGQSELFGYYDDNLDLDGLGNGIPGEEDLFGWFELGHASDGLTLVQQGAGVVGTRTFGVPEPSSLCLFLGLVAGGVLRRRRR